MQNPFPGHIPDDDVPNVLEMGTRMKEGLSLFMQSPRADWWVEKSAKLAEDPDFHVLSFTPGVKEAADMIMHQASRIVYEASIKIVEQGVNVVETAETKEDVPLEPGLVSLPASIVVAFTGLVGPLLERFMNDFMYFTKHNTMSEKDLSEFMDSLDDDEATIPPLSDELQAMIDTLTEEEDDNA